MAQILRGSDQYFENCLEGVSAPEPCCVDGCAHISLGLGGPHGAVAVGDFPLDHAGPQLSFRAVVGGLDFAGIIAKGQKLVSRAPDFGLQLARQVAFRRRAENIGELLFKRALFAGDCRSGETGDISGQIEGFAEPQLEPQGQIVRSPDESRESVPTEIAREPAKYR